MYRVLCHVSCPGGFREDQGGEPLQEVRGVGSPAKKVLRFLGQKTADREWSHHRSFRWLHPDRQIKLGTAFNVIMDIPWVPAVEPLATARPVLCCASIMAFIDIMFIVVLHCPLCGPNLVPPSYHRRQDHFFTRADL